MLFRSDYGRLELRYVPIDRGAEANRAGIEAYLRETVDAEVRVELVAVDEIPRHPSGKFEEFVSLVPRQGA